MSTEHKPAWFWAEEARPEMWTNGPFDSRDEAIADARLTLGRCIADVDLHVGVGDPCGPSDFLPSSADITDMIGQNAVDNGGPPEDYPDVSAEAEAEIDAFLTAWAAKHITKRWWCDIKPEPVEMADRFSAVKKPKRKTNNTAGGAGED